MKKSLNRILAFSLLTLAIPACAFADTWVRVNEAGVDTAYMYNVESGFHGTYFEIQATNGKPEVRDGLDAVWNKNPNIICAGFGAEGNLFFNRVVLANKKKDSSGRYIPEALPYANISYKFTKLDNGNIRVYPIYTDGRYWPAVVDLSGDYYNASAMTFPSENILIAFLPEIHEDLTLGMFKNRGNKIVSKLLTEEEARKKYPGIAENLDNAYSIKVTDKATKKKVEFVGNRCLDWIYRINPDGSAFPIHNKNGLG